MNKLHYSTVGAPLRSILEKLMRAEVFDSFRLVGGTALSLHLGHRISVDIDLFTDKLYGTIDFQVLEKFFQSHFKYVDCGRGEIIGFGKMYMIGESDFDNVKVDLMYTDPFIREPLTDDGIRLASVEDITAMKLDILMRAGRKKDFWDLHALADVFSLDQMLALHKERYPYTHDADLILHGFQNFSKADYEFDPDCLLGKHWETIRMDIIDFVKKK